MKSFSSDNYSGASPEILQALQEANQGHVAAYGKDPYTEKAIALIKEKFGNSIKVYFVYNGTAANSLSLKAAARSHHAIICSDSAHILNHEVGAPVNLIGCMLISIANENGKITAEKIEEAYLKAMYWGRHGNIPKVVTIAQATEFGTVYTKDELLKISAVCKKYNLIFHMNGCRLVNAAVHLNSSLKELTADIGVDILSFGGTKNGLLFGEAVIFFREDLAHEFEYIQKQGLQLQSKMRFLSAQFIPYLEKDIWYRNAKQANDMCAKLLSGLQKIDSINLAFPVESNQIFAYFPKELIDKSQMKFPYYVWDESKNLIRLVTSFDNTIDDIDQFLRIIS